MIYKVTIGTSEYLIDESDIAELDLIRKGNNSYHILSENKAYTLEVQSIQGKSSVVNIAGKELNITIADEYDQLVDKMGLSVVASQKMTSVKAPMPGLVLEIIVSPGDEVSEGSDLLILEAMKMENVLKASGEGIVKSIEVNKGEAVEKGAILIEME